MKNWIEGNVDIEEDHIKLWYQGNPKPIALVANYNGKITVQFLDESIRSEEEKKETLQSLNFFLTELDKEDPWKYAIYHTSTASNIYSKVQWGYFPKGYTGRTVK